MDDEQSSEARKQRIFRAWMAGLMAGSGLFLALRYIGNVAVDPALIVSTGIGIAVAMFLWQQAGKG